MQVNVKYEIENYRPARCARCTAITSCYSQLSLRTLSPCACVEGANKHTEIVTGVSWSASNELLTVGDDKKVWLWNAEGEPQVQVIEVDTFCTALLWFPSIHGRSKETDIFVVGCTDGSFKLISRAGRVEKAMPNAHSGAITALKWSHDGSSLATCGEDGHVKSWSRNGMFRANLAQVG